jgi:hypothetical protein
MNGAAGVVVGELREKKHGLYKNEGKTRNYNNCRGIS